MPYMMEVCTAGETIEVSKYYSARYGKRSARSENRLPTSKKAQQANWRQAEKRLRRLMNANFRDKVDALVTLDFAPGGKPETYEDMKRRMQNFLQRLRRRYKKLGLPCRYIWVGEIGPKGGVHVHMMLNDVDRIGAGNLMEIWGEGATHIDSLWSGGQYGKIAAYFLKYADKTESTTGEHLGRKWNPSHGLRQPKIVRTVVNRMSFQKKVKARKGYHLEKDKDGNTVRYGISDLTGLPYLSYTMIRD